MNPKSTPWKTVLYCTLGMIWLLVVILFYAYTHKPFSPDQVIGLLKVFWQIIIVLIVLLISGGLGFLLLGNEDGAPLSQASIQAALGLGIISLLTLLLATLIGLSSWLLGISLVIGGFTLRKNIVLWWSQWDSVRKQWTESGRFEKTIAVFSIIILLCNFLIALAPPLRFDALSYHLSLPVRYMQSGKIAYLPDNVFWGMPENTEILYTLVGSLAGIEAAPLLEWMMGILAITALYGHTKKRISQRAAWVAIAALLAGETISSSLAWGYVEWPSALYATAMFITLDNTNEGPDKKQLLLAGIFAGFALATKYTAGIVLLAGLGIIFFKFRGIGHKASITNALWFGGIATLTMLPWLLKNELATSNPFYPFFFPAGAMDEIRLGFYQKAPAAVGWLKSVALPWQITVWGVEGRAGYSSSVGPLLLGLSPLAWLSMKSRLAEAKSTIQYASIFVLIGFASWAVASNLAGLLHQTRLYFAMFPAWAILAGIGFDTLSKQTFLGIRFGRISSVLILLILGFNVFKTYVDFNAKNPVAVLLGSQTRETYLRSNLGAYAYAMEKINQLPPESKILMLWEARDFYCLPRCDGDEVIDRWYHDVHELKKPETILNTWRSEGYTHLLYYRAGAEFVRLDNADNDPDFHWEVLDTLLATLPQVGEVGDSYSLYLLDAP
jgi:hypothetical protein